MGGFLSIDNILSEDEAVNYFTDTPQEENIQATSSEPEKKEETNKEKDNIVEVNPDSLFDDIEEKPESVDSGKESNQEDTSESKEDDGTSPNKNFFSSVAVGLKDEGIFPDIDDAEVEGISSAEEFRDLIDKLIKAELNEVQQRIYKALQDGVNNEDIKYYEGTLAYLNNITEDAILAETQEGETLRRKLIEQDLMNNGYSPERAKKHADRMFNSGEDIEEAKEALISNKAFFKKLYDTVLEKAEQTKKDRDKEDAKRQEQLKKDILKTEKVFGDVTLDDSTRRKVYDNIMKPIYKTDNGKYLTALQKYLKENETEWLKNIGIIFTLTDGFKNLDNLIKPQAKKEVKSRLKELENTLTSSAKVGGNLKYVGSKGGQSNNFFDEGFSIDIN